MRLLVVSASAPDSSFTTLRNVRIADQPPGPGFGLQPPSVQISTTLSGSGGSETMMSSETIGTSIGGRHVKAQPAQIFQRVLAGHQRAGRGIQPVIETGEQKADRRTL